MRKYINIDLAEQKATKDEIDGEDVIVVGRHLIAKTLLERGVAEVDALSPENPLIFSAGPFAGSNFSNANRLSIGCKSPLTGGIKEANSGGTFAFAMGQLEISGITLDGASKDWVVIYITKDGDINYEDASPYVGKGNFEVAGMLFEKYGDKVSIGICGPVGEYGGLISGISFTDPEQRPTRIAARGGDGAVMGSKRVKAIVLDRNKMPSFHDRKKVMERRHFVSVKNNRLDSFATHDRAVPTARSYSGWALLRIGETDTRYKATIFTNRATNSNTYFVTIFFKQHPGNFKVTLAYIR
jgi:aldehyde:ferredoxin oxidoreductase